MRDSLRPPHSQTPTTSLGWTQQAPARPPWLIPAILGAGGVLLLLAFLVGQQYRPCSDLAQERKGVEGFLAKGQPALAIGLAESALAAHGGAACTDARRSLTLVWYRASMEQLLSTPGTEESASQQTPARWLAIEQKADQYAVARSERLSPMRVASRAYAVGNWPLADTAYKRAWEAGDVGLDTVGTRYAILRNWGRDLAFRHAAPSREQGVRLLATAQAIATAYKLPNGEACQDLRELGYDDCTQPTPDTLDPVLAAAKQ